MVDNSVEAFGSSKDNSMAVLEEFRDVFGRDELFVVLAEGPVFTTEFLEKLDELHTELEAMDMEIPSLGERKRDRDVARDQLGLKGESDGSGSPGPRGPPKTDDESVEEAFAALEGFGDDDGWGEEDEGSIVERITSLLNVRQTVGTPDGGMEVGELIDEIPRTVEEMAALRATVLGDPAKGVPPNDTLIGQVVGYEGRHALVVIQTQFMDSKDSERVYRHIREVIAKHEGEHFKTYLSGGPALAASLNRLMLDDLGKLGLLAMLCLMIVMFIMFRHPIGALAPGAVCICAGIWAFGFSAAAGIPMTMLSQILPAFIICVGVADSVHLQSVYRQARRDGYENRDAVVYAVAHVGMPIFFTSLTTAVGLGSFRFASLTAVGQMGTVGAAGVFIAFFQTIILLPICLSFNKKSLLGAGVEGARDFIDTFLEWCVGLSAGSNRRRIGTLVGAGLLTLLAGYGVMQLRVWHNPVSWVPDSEHVRRSLDTHDEHAGGTAAVLLMIEAKGERGIKDLELVQGLEALEKDLKGYPHPAGEGTLVRNTISVLDLVRESNQALMGGGPEHHVIPHEQRALTDRFMAFENAGPDEMKRLMTIDGTTAQLTASMRWLDATSYLPFKTFLEDSIKRNVPGELARVRPTGTMYTLLSSVGALIMDLLATFGVAFGIISLLLILLLRDLKLGLIGMVPNLLPIVFILGLMGLADIPIDMANILIASIALGIAVDDTIHFLHHFQDHYKKEGDTEAAILHSMAHSGRALVVTSIILCAGFFVYIAATMVNMQRFGALIGITVIMALLLDLIVTPALLRTFYKQNEPTQEEGQHA
jgi:predicted RND superfamily exporter protein